MTMIGQAFRLLLLLLAALSCHATKKKKILSFGASGQVSFEVISLLKDEYDIIAATRGNDYHDSNKHIEKHVHQWIEIDRDDGGLEELQNVIDSLVDDEEFYAVLDFSHWHLTHPDAGVRDAINVLKGKTRVYILASCAWVYEIMAPPSEEVHHAPAVLESDAVLPTDAAKIEELQQEQDYGFQALQAEHELTQQQEIPFVILRFAELLGPREYNEHIPFYIAWTKYQNKVHGVDFSDFGSIPNLHLPHDMIEEAPATYSLDAARMIVAAMHNEQAWNDIYNVACQETLNVTQVVHMVRERTLKPGDKHLDDPIPIVKEGRPAVEAHWQQFTRGPLDISKAREKLGFQPAPLDVAVNHTIDWFLEQYWTKKSAVNKKARKEQLKNWITDWAYNVLWSDTKDDEKLEEESEQVWKVLRSEL